MMRNITFTPEAYTDFINWLKTDKKLFIKITNLIREVAKTPDKGTGKPELLKNEYSGYWSRRITREHRLIYQVTEKTIKIISCKYHYK
jgi:toxin YoeB